MSFKEDIKEMPRYIWKTFFYTCFGWIILLIQTLASNESTYTPLMIIGVVLVFIVSRNKFSWMILLSGACFTVLLNTWIVYNTWSGDNFDRFAYPLVAVCYGVYLIVIFGRKDGRAYYRVSSGRDYSDAGKEMQICQNSSYVEKI